MIDSKELRVGSHVEIGGIHRAVFGLGCDRVSYLPHPTSSVALSVSASKVNPIPITPELLQEIGFEWDVDRETIYWRKDFDDEQYVMLVIYDGYICVRIHSKGACSHNVFKCTYLHELETYVYLTLHEELIKDELWPTSQK